MIRHIKHKGLRAVWEHKSYRGVPAEHAKQIGRILHALNLATRLDDLNLPGWRLHPLKGKLQGHWSITVQANWRIIFMFIDGDATNVDYVDYH